MKKVFNLILTGMVILSTSSCSSSQSLGKILNDVNKTVSRGNPTNSEISSGLKQALQIGIQEGVKQISTTDGFYKDPLIKILFPPEAEKVANTLKTIGLGSLVDNTVLSLNRAAEQASREALPIFLNALKGMSVKDASKILLGNDTSATHYFRESTTTALAGKFNPIIAQSLDKVDATKYWSSAMEQYNKIPLVKPVTTDLTAYVTQKAIDGLFTVVGNKEKAIRSNLADRSTPLLKKVFGYADQNK